MTTPATPDGVKEALERLSRIPRITEPAEAIAADLSTIHAALEQREAEVRELRDRLQFWKDSSDDVHNNWQDDKDKLTAAESRLGEADKLLREALQLLDYEHYADRPVCDRITDFFKGVEGG